MKWRIRQIAAGLLFCFILISYISIKVQAATPEENEYAPYTFIQGNFTISVTYGVSQQARYGRYTDMCVEISNKGGKFSGICEITMVNQDQDNVRYSKEITLPAGSKTIIDQILFVNQYTTEIQLKLLDSYGDTAVESKIPWNIKNYADNYCIGILSQNYQNLSYFEYFGNKIFYLNESQLRDDYRSYDMLDAIVVNQFDLDTLSIEQLQALLQYIERGGNLILGAGEDYLSNLELLHQYNVFDFDQSVGYTKNDIIKMDLSVDSAIERTELLTQIKNFESNRTQLQKQFESSETMTEEAKNRCYLGDSMIGNLKITDLRGDVIHKDVTRFTIKNTSNQTIRNGERIFEASPYGQGIVMVYHFDLGNEKITPEKLQLYEGCTDGLFSLFYADIVHNIKSNVSQATVDRLYSEAYQRMSDYRVLDMGQYPKEKESPKVGGLIVVFIIYLILIGPVVFITLWKLKKNRKIWVIIPCISFIFFLLIIAMGNRTRVKSPYAGVLNIEYFDDQQKSVRGESYALISLHKHSPVTVELDTTNSISAGSWMLPDYYEGFYQNIEQRQKYYDYDEANIDISSKEQSTLISFYDQPAFQTKMFTSTYQRDYVPLVQSDIQISQNAMTGTVTNVSGETLLHAMIGLTGHYILLGDLAPGETKDLSDGVSYYSSSMDELLYTKNPIAHELGLNMDTLSNSQQRMINAFTYASERFATDEQRPYFISAINQAPLESTFSDLLTEEYSYGDMVEVVQLTDVKPETSERRILNMDIYLKNDNEYSWDRDTRCGYLNTLDFEYQIPNGIKLKQIYLSDLFLPSKNDENFTKSGCSRIYLYDYTASQYELVFDLNSEYATRSIGEEDLKRFVNQDNQIMIRYENQDASEYFLVPVISCIEEAEDA